MKKKIVSFLLVLALCLSMGTVVFADESGSKELFLSEVRINGDSVQVVAVAEQEESGMPKTRSSEAKTVVEKSVTFYIPITERAFDENSEFVESYSAGVGGYDEIGHKFHPSDFLAVRTFMEYEKSGGELDGQWIDDLKILIKTVKAEAYLESGSVGELYTEVVCSDPQPAPVKPGQGFTEQETTIYDMSWGYRYFTPSNWVPVVGYTYSNLFVGYARFNFWYQDNNYDIIFGEDLLVLEE